MPVYEPQERPLIGVNGSYTYLHLPWKEVFGTVAGQVPWLFWGNGLMTGHPLLKDN